MNIAIMVCGEMRWFDNFRTTFENNFKPSLIGHSVQYFAHFWNQDLEKLSNFTDVCCPITLDIEDKISYSSIKTFFGNTKNVSGTLPNQAYGAYKSFLLLKKYQEENNITFDLFIKMRTDLAFLSEIKFDNFDLESVYVKDIVHWRPTKNYVNDYIYFTKNYDAVQKIANLGFSLDFIVADPNSFIYQRDIPNNIFCPEEMLAKHLDNNNISIKTYNFNIDLARHHI